MGVPVTSSAKRSCGGAWCAIDPRDEQAEQIRRHAVLKVRAGWIDERERRERTAAKRSVRQASAVREEIVDEDLPRSSGRRASTSRQPTPQSLSTLNM